jgi:hypothetical protein
LGSGPAKESRKKVRKVLQLRIATYVSHPLAQKKGLLGSTARFLVEPASCAGRTKYPLTLSDTQQNSVLEGLRANAGAVHGTF